MPDLVYPSVIAVARAVFALQGLKFRVDGAADIPRTGGAVMAINHFGYFDFTYAGYAALPARRYVRFMAKQEVFSHPVAGPLMRGMRHIPVDRAAGAGSYRSAVTALRSGEIVGVFPEATLSRSFELKEFKSGAARMAAEAGVPLLPTVIWGSQRVWTKDHPRRLGRSGVPIQIRVGAPIAVPPDADPVKATLELRECMSELLRQAQEQYPDHARPGEDAWWLPARLGGTAPTPEQATALDSAELRERVAQRAAKRRARQAPRNPNPK